MQRCEICDAPAKDNDLICEECDNSLGQTRDGFSEEATWQDIIYPSWSECDDKYRGKTNE